LTQEKELLSLILECVLRRHGKALIPVFALGKAQQLCLLLESCWTRLGLQIPIFFAQGMAEQATTTFGLFADWGSQAVRDSTLNDGRNPYRFQHASLWRSEHLAREAGPCVLFASPGMLQGGLALEVFRAWAPFESNAVLVVRCFVNLDV
jgi:integrator complex subunit 11